jgi:hypothetical protein
VHVIAQNPRARIDREAEGQIQLGQLLRAQRPAAAQAAAERIAASALSVAMKIERIRTIDALKDHQAINETVRQTTAQAARLQAAREQRALKRPQKACSFLRFLFRERVRLTEFGRKTHVLETTFLPPGVRPARDLQGFFVRSLQAWAAGLSPSLKGLLEHAWLYLTPFQYNLLALLRKLCDRVLTFDFVHLDYRSRHLIDRLQRIERPFLTLACRDEHLPAILGAVQTVCKKTHAEEKECGELCSLAQRVLAPEATLPSLYNAVIGLNSIKNRRLMAMADLVSPGRGGLINTRDFDCDGQLRKRIDSYLRESLDSVRKLHEQLFEARRLGSYIRRDEGGEPDTSRLVALYTGEGEGRDFLADQANTVRFASRLCRRFDRAFLPLLGGRITLADGTMTSIFSRNFFEVELSRLRTLADKLDKGPFHFTDFPLERYGRIKGGRLSAIGAEGEAIQLVDEATAILVDLGKTLARVLGLRGPAGDSGARQEPLEPIVLQGKSFTLPMENQRVAGPSPLANLTVAEALGEVVTICFSAGLLFRDRFLDLYLSREGKIDMELQTRLRLLENLMVPEDYRELVATFR